MRTIGFVCGGREGRQRYMPTLPTSRIAMDRLRDSGHCVDAPGRNVYTGVQRVSTSPSPPFTARKQSASARIPLRRLCRDLCFVANRGNLDPASKTSEGHAILKCIL